MSNVVMELTQSNGKPANGISLPVSKWQVVKAAHSRILPRKSQGELKLNNLINDLQKYATTATGEVDKQEEILVTTTWDRINLFRRRISNILQQPAFHYVVILLVITDLVVVLIDLVLAQLSSPCLSDDELDEYNTTVQRDSCILPHSSHLDHADLFLFYFSVLLLSLFVFEVFLSMYAFGYKYCKSPLYLIDGVIVLFSFVLELYFHYGHIGRAGRAASAIILIRLWKIVRAIHAVAHSITIKNRMLIERIQEAQILLEEEKHQAEQTLEKQEIRVNYLVHILTNIGKLPTNKQIEKYVNDTWTQRQTEISKS